MTYDDFMEIMRPIIRDAFKDGRKGIEYAESVLAEWETQYVKQHGEPMSNRIKHLCALTKRMMVDANREGLKLAKETVT